MSGQASASGRPSRFEKVNVVDDKTRQKLKIQEDDPFLKKSLGDQIKIEKQIEKKLGWTGPGRFFGDHRGLQEFLKLVSYRILILRFSLLEARNRTTNKDKQKELDRLINTLEDDQVKITAGIDTKGKYCSILDSYLAERMRHSEEQQLRHERRIKRLQQHWDEKYDQVCKDLKYWKDEAEFKHGDMKRQFAEEAKQATEEMASKSENVTEVMVQQNMAVQHDQENLLQLAKKGQNIQTLLTDSLKAVKDVRGQVNRGGMRSERQKLGEEHANDVEKAAPETQEEQDGEEEQMDDEQIANIRTDMDKLLQQLIEDVKKLDTQLEDMFKSDEKKQVSMRKEHDRRMEQADIKHANSVQEINKQFAARWKARSKVLTAQTNDYTDKLNVSERIEHMIKENERMKLTAASLSHYFDCVTGDTRSEYDMLKKEHAELKKSCHVLRMALNANIRPVQKK